MQPLALLDAIGQMLPKDAVVVEEALSSAPGIRSLITSDDPQSFFGLRGGGIGWGLPAAIGAKLALPDRPVVAIVGDGSSLYTMQALWTAARYRIPVIWVILNNTSYRILKQRLVAMRGLAEQADTFVGMELNDPAVDFISSRALARHRSAARQDRARGDRPRSHRPQGWRFAPDRRRHGPQLTSRCENHNGDLRRPRESGDPYSVHFSIGLWLWVPGPPSVARDDSSAIGR